MEIETSEKIRILCKMVGISLGELAERTGQSRQNLSNKFSRNNFSEQELKNIAEALGCRYHSEFVLPDGDRL